MKFANGASTSCPANGKVVPAYVRPAPAYAFVAETASIRRMAMRNVGYRVLGDHLGGEPLRREVALCATPEEPAACGRGASSSARPSPTRSPT